MAEQFYTILTAIGKAKIANATALGNKVNFTTLKVGDSNGKYYNPTETQEDLINAVWQGNINSISVDKKNPNWIVIEVIIPSNIGGFVIREAGIFDDEGDLIAIGKYPETYKPKAEDGSTKDLIIKMILEVSNTSTVTLKVDPTVILATKKDIEVLENKIKNIKVPVTSVNSKTGAIELKAEDINCNDGKNLEKFKESTTLQLADITKDIKNIDLSADKVTLDSTKLKSKDVKTALEELFTFADNGKKDWVDVIGSPLSTGDSFSTLKSKTQTLKNTFASNLMSKGQSASGTEGLNSLIAKVKSIDTGFKFATGEISFPDNKEVTELSFVPLIVYLSGTNYCEGKRYPLFYMYVDDRLVSDKMAHNNWYVRSFYSGSTSEPIMQKKGIWIKNNGFEAYNIKFFGKDAKLTWIALGSDNYVFR
ncbi:phage tail protein [Clostridium tetani]|uniref:phage tail protein n=1 Tax=Clostridium tetani TaxID=1513 RepID=UPI00100AB3A3|nr:phage tail protein [Clostridium tetani]RXM69439.1 phage tail protein [Clostridium tetani]